MFAVDLCVNARSRERTPARATQLTFLYIVVPWKQLNFALRSDTLMKNKIFSLALVCVRCLRDLTLWTAIASQCTFHPHCFEMIRNETKRNLCTNIGVTSRVRVQRIYFAEQPIWNISLCDSEKSNKIKKAETVIKNSILNCIYIENGSFLRSVWTAIIMTELMQFSIKIFLCATGWISRFKKMI